VLDEYSKFQRHTAFAGSGSLVALHRGLQGQRAIGVREEVNWAVWVGFFGAIADRFWPDLNEARNDSKHDSERRIVPPLAVLKPNSRPLPDPCVQGNSLEIVKLLANGSITPQDLHDEMINEAN
jgi:hypothetical protein